ncbi:MAG: class I SAM-dependent methyltransferase [Gammaproteobacteria bacterium]|nr:class I SAM-dependent methyltransferase [Gammaproteobacteria bacterium]
MQSKQYPIASDCGHDENATLQALAQQRLRAQAESESGRYRLVMERSALRLEEMESGLTLMVDFIGGAVGHRRLFGGGKGQPLARAVGCRGSGAPPKVVDATAGLGRDAFVLASLGCQVAMVEADPVVAALLVDGLRRGEEDSEVAAILGRLSLCYGSSIDYLHALTPEEIPQVVYLDPMYPHKRGTARVKKEMALLQQLIPPPTLAEEGELLQMALERSQKRVVVKRPKGAPPLALKTPSAVIATKKNRFDLYFVSPT